MEESNVSQEVNTTQGKPNLLLYGAIIAVVVLAIPMLMNGKKKSEASANPTPEVMATSTPMVENVTASPTPTATMTPAVPVNGVITVEAGSFYYKPNLIQVKKGQKVKLTMNSVSMMHDFNVDELGIKVPVTKSGSSATITFTANKVGAFEFYCSVGQHRANGQVGKLIVTE